MSNILCSTRNLLIWEKPPLAHTGQWPTLGAIALLAFLVVGCAGPRFENGVSVGTGKSGASSLTIPVPPSTNEEASGDLLISILGVQANPNTQEPEGWKTVPGFAGFNGATCAADSGGTACQLAIFYRIADGSETSVTLDWGTRRHAAGAVLRYSNVDQAAPIGEANQQRGSSNTPTAPVVTTSRNDSRIMRIALAEMDDAMTFLEGTSVLTSGPRSLRVNLVSFPDAETDPAAGCGPPLSGCRETENAVALAVSDEGKGSAGGSGTASWDLPAGDQWLTASFEIRGTAND
jgi:hypothetical protein